MSTPLFLPVMVLLSFGVQGLWADGPEAGLVLLAQVGAGDVGRKVDEPLVVSLSEAPWDPKAPCLSALKDTLALRLAANLLEGMSVRQKVRLLPTLTPVVVIELQFEGVSEDLKPLLISVVDDVTRQRLRLSAPQAARAVCAVRALGGPDCGQVQTVLDELGRGLHVLSLALELETQLTGGLHAVAPRL